MRPPTSKQAEYLRFIGKFTARHGYAPSFEEIARHFMVSPPSVNNMVKTLEAKGFLARVRGASRSLRVLVAPSPDAAAAPGQRSGRSVGKDPGARDGTVTALSQFARLVVSRLPQALGSLPREALHAAFDAVCESLEVQLAGLAMPKAARAAALKDLIAAARQAENAHRRPTVGRTRAWARRGGAPLVD